MGRRFVYREGRGVIPIEEADALPPRGADGLQVRVDPGPGEKTRNLPKHYPYHAAAGGEFAEDGTCIVKDYDQIRRTVAIANDHGEGIVWDGFKEIS